MEGEAGWTMLQTRRLLGTALSASLAAGQEVLRIYCRGFSVGYKEDRSPVTEADGRAHRILESCLAAGGGRFPFLSEEGASVPVAERRAWPAYWLTDPLDGTREFVARNGEFSINVALIAGARPVLGVVHLPASGDTYFAARSLGAFRLRSTETCRGVAGGDPSGEELIETALAEADPLPVVPPTGSSPRLRIVCSRHHRLVGQEERFLSAVRAGFPGAQLVAAGGALKFCLLAEGSAEIYPRFGPTMEWDTAAGQCVLEAAGGCVADTATGAPLQYNKENLRNGPFVALAAHQGRLAADLEFVLAAMRAA